MLNFVAKHDWRKSLDGFPEWKTIVPVVIKFLTISWHFLPHNFPKPCPNDLKFGEKVALIEIDELFKSDDN